MLGWLGVLGSGLWCECVCVVGYTLWGGSCGFSGVVMVCFVGRCFVDKVYVSAKLAAAIGAVLQGDVVAALVAVEAARDQLLLERRRVLGGSEGGSEGSE